MKYTPGKLFCAAKPHQNYPEDLDITFGIVGNNEYSHYPIGSIFMFVRQDDFGYVHYLAPDGKIVFHGQRCETERQLKPVVKRKNKKKKAV